ncbi:MAG TPA: SWIM zinc finger family protein [Streptosporangiaceae bacterium]|nr:SWIM zinc finger family protein [Streptosporangiaceae bacterium]
MTTSDWHEYGPPISVEGGVRARSKRGSIGERWWSRRFIDVLESFGMSGRLARGRNYARRGQVIGFEISCGYVTAEVQGSRPKPYRVRIQVTPLTKPQWRRVEEALAAQALFRARLLAGEMPREIEEVFADCGTPLFPRSARDMDMSCSCPDWGVPCKHLAAVCYVLAEAFDDDPFGILAWRGRGREDILGALRLTPGAAEPARPLLDVTDRPLAECVADYWSPGMSAARLRALPPAPATPPDLLLRTFEPPVLLVRGTDLQALLAPAYEQLAEPDKPAEPDELPGV